MDPQRRKIYISLIVVCVLASVIIIWWSRSGVVTAPLLPKPASSQIGSQAIIKPSIDGTYPAPLVFPLNQKLDASVLDSSIFKTLKPYAAGAITQPDLGRDDPFNTY